MECERLNRLIRLWYEQVQDESMAPARMVEFMESHIADCEICLSDPDVKQEVKKISEIVLPTSKMTKAARKEAGLDADGKSVEPDDPDDEPKGEEDGDYDDDLDPVFMEDDDAGDGPD